MLINTVENDPSEITFRLDGRLAAAGVCELARSRSAAVVNQPRQPVSFDPAGLTSMDVLGRECLAHVQRRGDGLIGSAATKVLIDAGATTPPGATGSARAGTSIIHVEGELRAPVDAELMGRVQAELRGGARLVRLDLSAVASIDAAGVGELVNVLNATTAAGAVLDVVNANSRVRRILEAAGVFQILTPAMSRTRPGRDEP